MDKITHQVRAEHWGKIMNGLKLPGVGKIESQKSSSSTGGGFCAGKLSRDPGIHYYRQLSNRIRSWHQHLRGRSPLPRSSFNPLLSKRKVFL